MSTPERLSELDDVLTAYTRVNVIRRAVVQAAERVSQSLCPSPEALIDLRRMVLAEQAATEDFRKAVERDGAEPSRFV